MKHYAKTAVVITCLLASTVALAVPSTPHTAFNTYSFDTLRLDDKLVDHNVANKNVSFTDLITFELAAGSTYDLRFAASSNSNSWEKKFSSFGFTLYGGEWETQADLLSATVIGSTSGSFSNAFSASDLSAGWYTLVVSGEGASNGAKYMLGVSSLTASRIPTTAPPIAGNVPEPETYAMLLAGLGLMGAVARRRSKD